MLDITHLDPPLPASTLAASTLARALSALGAIALAPSAVAACPDCSTTRVVRSAVFDERFWSHLLWMVLPLAVLSIVAVLLSRIGRAGVPSRASRKASKS